MTGSFVTIDLQSQIKRRIGWIIPLKQIRKVLTESFALNNK